MKIFFYADVSKSSGYGHFVRIYSLSKQFIKKDIEIIFVINNSSKEILQFIKKNRIKSISFKLFLLSKIKKSIIIIDSYEVKKKLFNSLIRENFIVEFNDIPKNQNFGDIVINNNLSIKKRIIKINKKIKYLVGSKFIIIRSEILKQKIYKKKIPKNINIKNIFISFGGFENKKYIIKILNCINENNTLISKKNINLFINASHYRNNILKLFEKNKNINLKFVDNKIFNSFNFKKIDISINAGGITSLEMIYLKIPQIGLLLSQNQKNNLNFIEKKKFGLLFFYNENNDFKNLFFKLINEYKIFIKNLNNQKVIDGLGTNRLVRSITKIYKNDIKKNKNKK